MRNRPAPTRTCDAVPLTGEGGHPLGANPYLLIAPDGRLARLCDMGCLRAHVAHEWRRWRACQPALIADGHPPSVPF